jgi:uncharacterized coiled-coil protein SlyX
MRRRAGHSAALILGANDMTYKSGESIQIKLESKIAFQEKTIADLNDALVDQTRIMLDLQRRVELLERIVRGIHQRLDEKTDALPYEKPPHY